MAGTLTACNAPCAHCWRNCMIKAPTKLSEGEAAAMAKAVEALPEDERDMLQKVCSLLVGCFGSTPSKAAVIVMANAEGNISVAALNADMHESYELLDVAATTFKGVVTEGMPPKELLN